MATLSDILDVEALERQVEAGLIRRTVSPDGRHTLYNYTDRAVYQRAWTPETRQCRGLIVRNSDGLIVCRPLDKFFNYGEPDADPLPDWKYVSVSGKLDGSMIAVWNDSDLEPGVMGGGGWRCTTRGSFDSPQAQAAQAWLDRNVTRIDLTVGQTYICEWVSPANRIVVKYDETRLALISVRDNHTGHEAISPFDWPPRSGLDWVWVYPETDSLDELVKAAREKTGIEGWVLAWYQNTSGKVGRLKIKTDEYLRLHKLISGFSVERVREQLLAGTADDYIASLPDEIQKQAEHIQIRILLRANRRELELRRQFDALRGNLNVSRRAFAEAVKTFSDRADHAHLFALADGRDIGAEILKRLDLADLEARQELEPA